MLIYKCWKRLWHLAVNIWEMKYVVFTMWMQNQSGNRNIIGCVEYGKYSLSILFLACCEKLYALAFGISVASWRVYFKFWICYIIRSNCRSQTDSHFHQIFYIIRVQSRIFLKEWKLILVIKCKIKFIMRYLECDTFTLMGRYPRVSNILPALNFRERREGRNRIFLRNIGT
jgi:hypothetical protein